MTGKCFSMEGYKASGSSQLPVLSKPLRQLPKGDGGVRQLDPRYQVVTSTRHVSCIARPVERCLATRRWVLGTPIKRACPRAMPSRWKTPSVGR